MALVTEFVDRVRSEHLIRAGSPLTGEADDGVGAKAPHRIVADGALERLSSNKRLLQWMMGLFICLSPDIPMAIEAKVRLGSHQQLFHSLVNGMAAIARVACKFVPVHIPERNRLRFFVAGHASCGLFPRAHFLAKANNGHASAPAFFNMLSPGTVAGFAPFPICGIPGNCLFAMNRFYKTFVICLMAILAGFRPRIL
jgi:hypothetical protein